MPTNLYGYFDNFDLETSHVLPAMLRKFHEAKENNTNVKLWGSGTPMREFLFVDDMAEAVVYALESLGIETKFVSRSKKIKGTLNYKDLSASDIQEHTLIVNCTPLGTHPNIEECPPIPYNEIGKNHLLYDLIYNPSETKFLGYGKKADAKTLNGLKMLELQAEKSWEIWHS